MNAGFLNWDDLTIAQQAATLRRPDASQSPAIAAAANAIVARVKQEGDAALRTFSTQFDKTELDDFAVGDEEFAAAANALTQAQLQAIDTAITNVRRFHEAQLTKPVRVETTPGVVCERIFHPLDAVGLYVPAGTAPLPSTAIMLTVPAAIAGCPQRILCTPPRPDGSADPAVLVVAQRSGIEQVYKLGGAQAIAAMAYGTESIPRVCKIFGPGNAFVTAAKTLVATDPDGAAIDMPAGPSEVLVIGDDSANPEFVASDLLAQAEHGKDSQVVFISTSEVMLRAVIEEMQRQTRELSRQDIIHDALQNSRLILVDTLETAIAISNRYAPEHLILQAESARSLLPTVRNAGSVFIGAWTPESVGDYCSGTNHVLPTYGYANTWSGLGVDQFRRSMTVQEVSRSGLAELRGTVVELASLEGLDAHAAAVTRRIRSLS